MLLDDLVVEKVGEMKPSGGTTALHVHVHTHYQPWQLRTFLKKMTFLVILRDTNTAHYIHKYDSARKHLTLSPLHTHLSLVCGMA